MLYKDVEHVILRVCFNTHINFNSNVLHSTCLLFPLLHVFAIFRKLQACWTSTVYVAAYYMYIADSVHQHVSSEITMLKLLLSVSKEHYAMSRHL